MAQIKTEFIHNGEELNVNARIIQSWAENGYIIVRQLLDPIEIDKLKIVLESDTIRRNVYGRDDAKGRSTKLCVWNHPGDDVSGMVARSNKVAGTVEKLLGGEVYHFHSKVIMKDAFTGGEHVWHQDYSYWYNVGCLYPDMASVFIAVDKATTENGCLQILRGSHKMGRVEHIQIGGQAGVQPERLEHILNCDRFELVHLELEPGDACFFHCNLLHTSAQNQSNQRRWAFITAFNRANNDPVMAINTHPRYTPLQKVPDSAIKECSNVTNFEGKDFYFANKDAFSLPGLQTTVGERKT